MIKKKVKPVQYAGGGYYDYIEDNRKRKMMEQLANMGGGENMPADVGGDAMGGDATSGLASGLGGGGGGMMGSLVGGGAGIFTKMLGDTVSGVSKGIRGESFKASDALGMVPIVGGILGPIAQAFEAKDERKRQNKMVADAQVAQDASYLQMYPTQGTNFSSYFAEGGYAMPYGMDMKAVGGGAIVPTGTGTNEGVIVGNKHSSGGVNLVNQGGVMIEAEGNESTDNLGGNVVIFSDRLKVPGTKQTYADVHTNLLADKQKIEKQYQKKGENSNDLVIDKFARNTYEKKLTNNDIKIKKLFITQQMENDNHGGQGGFANGGMMYPDGGTVPTRQEIDDWNNLIKFYNSNITTNNTDRAQLDRSAGNTSDDIWKQYTTANPNFKYEKDSYVKKMQTYYNDLYNNPMTQGKVGHPPSQLSDVDGWIGQNTSQYYIPTYHNGIVDNTKRVQGSINALFNPYATDVKDTYMVDQNNLVNMDSKEAITDMDLAKSFIHYAKGGVFAKGGIDPNGDETQYITYDENGNPITADMLYNNPMIVPPVRDPNNPIVMSQNKPVYVTGNKFGQEINVRGDNTPIAKNVIDPVLIKDQNPLVPQNLKSIDPVTGNETTDQTDMTDGVNKDKFDFATMAPYMDNVFNAVATSMSPKVPYPNLNKPAPLNTTFDINAPLAANVRRERAINTDIDKNTSSSSVARMSKLQNEVNTMYANNNLYTTKENTENQMENQKMMNDQQVASSNLAKIDMYNVDNAMRTKSMLSQMTGNVANAVSDFTQQQAEKNMKDLDKQRWMILSKQFKDTGVVAGNLQDTQFMKDIYKQYPDMLVSDIKNLKKSGRATDEAVKLYNEINGTTKTIKDFE